MALCLVCALVGGVAGGAGVAAFSGNNSGGSTTLVEGERTPTVVNVSNVATKDPLTASQIYQAYVGSTVGITTEIVTTNYFGQPVSQAAAGSGFVISDNGYILTNYHVIKGASSIKVAFMDGTNYDATLVGGESENDIAVLKINASGLSPVVLGNSDNVQVGEQVVAIGNPMGEQLRGTMTDGILSAINRDMEVDGNTMTLLQTTAALNSGNSGGPLFDMYGQVIALVNDQGQVIGITNMKLISNVSDNTLEGLGFAIPTTTVKPVVDALIANGVVTGRPTLGVTVRAMYAYEKEEYGVDQGLLVVSVTPGSGADGRLEAGDVLLTANGTGLNAINDLMAVRDSLQAGDSIDFQVQRGEEALTVSVELMEQYQLEG